MKLCKMIEIYLKYDNMHPIRIINAFSYINNHVNSSRALIGPTNRNHHISGPTVHVIFKKRGRCFF